MMPQVTSIVDGYFATQVYAVARLDNGWKRHHHIRVERRPFFANENSNHSRIVKATATNNSTSSSVSIFGRGRLCVLWLS